MFRNWRKPKPGAIVFYSLYGAGILAFVIALACVLSPLKAWLNNYEASQPHHKAQAVFDQLFAQPDWAALYEKAGIQDTTYEGREAYAAYMKKLVGDREISYLETAAGLSGDYKYVVNLENQKIATFTLTDATQGKAEIPDWTLGKLELLFQRNESALISKLPGQTVYINGVALDESHTIRKTATGVETLLPEGLHGYRMEQQMITGLLQQPEVTIMNEDGTLCPVKHDAAKGIYEPQLPEMEEMTDQERELIIQAAKANALYVSIRAISQGELAKHFDSSSKVYKAMVESLAFVQRYKSYEFKEDVTAVSNFYRYSDDLFSATVTLHLDVTRYDYNVGEDCVTGFPLQTTYFFHRNGSGKILVNNMTNVPVYEQESQVRLTFCDGEQVLSSEFVAADAAALTLPQVTAPEGKVLKGWAKQEKDSSGKITMTILFVPGEDQQVQLPKEQLLEPMTLYAVFDVPEVG